MPDSDARSAAHQTKDRLLPMLERLLALPATEVKDTLDRASQLVTEALRADKVDIFIHDPHIDTLVALGVSNTPLGQHQRAIGMDRLPIANGGRAVSVFQTGMPYGTGRADQDPEELAGIKQGLGVRSTLAVPLDVETQRRGVLLVTSAQPDRFTENDLQFLQAVARWVGMVMQRAELVEQMTGEAAEQARRGVADELIMMLAHDLRAPLAPLKGRVEMLHSRAEREGRPRDMADAAAASRVVDRLQRMISDLLDVGRLEQALFALSVDVVDLTVLARQTADTLQGQGAEIHVRSPEGLVVEADQDRIRQALENLLGNALRHSPSGVPVVLELSAETRADGEWAVLTVRDEGPGIDPQLLPSLFTRFARGSGAQGLGLGLYLARGIAEAHGGTLTVESTPGKGASFRLGLPVARSPERASPKDTAPNA